MMMMMMMGAKQRQNDRNKKRWGSICAPPPPTASFSALSPPPPSSPRLPRPFQRVKVTSITPPFSPPPPPPALPLNYSLLRLLSAVLLTPALAHGVWNGSHWWKSGSIFGWDWSLLAIQPPGNTCSCWNTHRFCWKHTVAGYIPLSDLTSSQQWPPKPDTMFLTRLLL